MEVLLAVRICGLPEMEMTRVRPDDVVLFMSLALVILIHSRKEACGATGLLELVEEL
jgi:hypothetical protein